MITKDNLHIGDEARQKLFSGIKKVAVAVGSTMGTGGSNAVIEAIESPGHLMTNDGYSIANSIVLADPIEEMGRKILVEAINRANKASGDGSSTTCVLTDAIIEEGMKHIQKGVPMDIKRSLDACVPLIEARIKDQTRQVEDSQLEQVATISAEDSEIGKRIADIYKEIGKSGIIHWDISKTAEDSYTIGKGITIEGAGYYSPYMCDATESGQSTNQVRIKNPYILVTRQKITSANEFNALASALHGKDVKDLVVFVDDIEPLVINDLLLTRLKRGFRIVIVKMPVIFKDHWFEDLPIATRAKVADPALGLPLKDTNIDHLGRCENIVITKDDTYIDGIEDLSSHVNKLEADGDDESLLRASRLNTKTARYYVGAQSDSALSYRRLKVEDAISATYQALNGGVVAGGGVALMRVAAELPTDTIGGTILKYALMSPHYQILSNAGRATEEVAQSLGVAHARGEFMGVNTKTGEVVDMFKEGILDPSNVVLNAVKNAISVAATVLTANTVVTLPRDEQPMQMPPVLR